MSRRGVPSSLWWLAALVALALVTAIISLGTLYVQTRSEKRLVAEQISDGHIAAGRNAIAAYGCGSCHRIPGVSGANGRVGPDLTGIAVRAHIAGSLPNDPETMARWLEHPQSLRPGSGMPEVGLSEQQSRDIAAYLYALK